jgi:hypothetical protein
MHGLFQSFPFSDWGHHYDALAVFADNNAPISVRDTIAILLRSSVHEISFTP